MLDCYSNFSSLPFPHEFWKIKAATSSISIIWTNYEEISNCISAIYIHFGCFDYYSREGEVVCATVSNFITWNQLLYADKFTVQLLTNLATNDFYKNIQITKYIFIYFKGNETEKLNLKSNIVATELWFKTVNNLSWKIIALIIATEAVLRG